MEVVMLLMNHQVKDVFQVKQNVHLRLFNLITGINKSKGLTKHISCDFKCKFNGKKCS